MQTATRTLDEPLSNLQAQESFYVAHPASLSSSKAPAQSRSTQGRLAEIAALSTDQVLSMTRSELADVIRSVRGAHLRPGVLERLSMMDGETLRRLVFLTRRFCRNKLLLSEVSTSPGTFASYSR